MQPVHPGNPGKQPFWNIYSKRFIYAPAFEFNEEPGADSYRFTITAATDSQTFVFTAKKPWVPLTPVWKDLPADRFQLTVEAIDEVTGKPSELAGERVFLKSPPFSGVTTEAAYTFRESGYRSLKALLHQPKTLYWLKHGTPDPAYPLWCHPTKIMSALIIGMIHYAEFFPVAEDADQAVQIAEIVVEFLLKMRQPAGTPLEHWPATYWDGIDRGKHPYFHNEIMTNSPAIAAEMLLDFYDFSQHETYFQAAKRIADTYVNTQRDDGTWPQILHTKTGQAVKRNLLVPTMVIELFDRLMADYDCVEYAVPREKAFS